DGGGKRELLAREGAAIVAVQQREEPRQLPPRDRHRDGMAYEQHHLAADEVLEPGDAIFASVDDLEGEAVGVEAVVRGERPVAEAAHLAVADAAEIGGEPGLRAPALQLDPVVDAEMAPDIGIP